MKSNDDVISKDVHAPILLRPHHGMCLAYFAGYGYSNEFSTHMYRVKNALEKDSLVKLVVETDIICIKCPNNIRDECDKPDLVKQYDTEVLNLCGLSAGDELKFGDFSKLVRERILIPGLRGEICGGCQWNDLCAE